MLRLHHSAIVLLLLTVASLPAAKPLKAPDGLFKDLNDSNASSVILLRETELFIDGRLISSMKGATTSLQFRSIKP